MVYLLFNSFSEVFLVFVLTFYLAWIIGIEDDYYNYRRRLEARKKEPRRQFIKTICMALIAIPVIFFQIGDSEISIYFFNLELGIFYWFFIVPLGVTTASNCTNLLAGLNGLEVGLGFLYTLFFGIILINESTELAILMFIFSGSLLGLLIFNTFPAKIFPGDSTTLVIGAVIAVVSVMSNLVWLAIFILLLPVLEFFVTLRVRFNAENFGEITERGTLRSPQTIQSLTHVIMRQGDFTEKEVVRIFWFLQLIIGILSIILYEIFYI